jgi:FkbM family methyltransferase
MGYALHLDVSRSNAQRLLYLEGERFVGERGLVAELVRPEDTVVDVGANIGYYSLLAARIVGPRGRIIAFEPEPDNLVELRMNIEGNGLGMAEIRPVAVGARAGTVSFLRGINGGVTDGAGDSGASTVQVPMVALDDVLEGPVGMIKIDVEGYEGEVLAGARRTIERCKPRLFVEIHPRMLATGHTVDSLFDFLFGNYGDVRLYEPARVQGAFAKLASRYLGLGAVEAMASRDDVASRSRAGAQDTFWAICR